jgi:Methane oxygenase PmoA
MMAFGLRQEDIELPQGAWAAGGRSWLCWHDKPVLGFTQGAFRPYVFPVHTPAGFALTSESPADHPHHHSIWVAADHVDLHVPAGPKTEVYSYNFYVNDVFQGRAPGRILQQRIDHQAKGDSMVVLQHLLWRGPREWGAPEGREVLTELRTTRIRHLPQHQAFQLEITSSLTAPTHPIRIGPTRHAWFNARVAAAMSPLQGGEGRRAGDLPASAPALPWRACTGSVGGGHVATLAIAPWPLGTRCDWYISPWGVMTANPCLNEPLFMEPGAAALTLGARLLVCDGRPTDEDIQQALSEPASDG